MQQPGALHRDHRLGGEICQERDLLVCERPDFLTEEIKHAKQGIVFTKRDQKLGSRSAHIGEAPASGISRPVHVVVGDIGDLHDILAMSDPVERHPRGGTYRLPEDMRGCWFDTPHSCNLKTFPIIGMNCAKC